MRHKQLSVAVPWSLSHYISMNGFHPIYRALFDQRPPEIQLHAWDNVKLYNRFKNNDRIQSTVYAAAENCKDKLKKFNSESIEKEYLEYFWAPNQVLTNELLGEIEFHHTAPFPSLKRPFVFHCESFSHIFFPFAQQGSGKFKKYEQIREHYRVIFANPLCLAIFSHIPETLEKIRQFFSDSDINLKLHSSRIGLSPKSLMGCKPPEKTTFLRPKFLFINSANQNSANFLKGGGQIVLRFWKEFRASGQDGQLLLRCAKPDKKELQDYGVDTSFLDAEMGDSILWAEDYLANHEMNALIANSHFLLLPSMSLQSASIMQAMAFGTIPVVTDTVGTSVYVTDEEHGIVLQGVREAMWFTDPNTGILVDEYRRILELEDSLVLQLTSRILAIIEEPSVYEKMRNRVLAHTRQQFSGEDFSSHFWASVADIYLKHKQQISHINPSPISQTLKDCILQEDDWPNVFESVPQPMLKVYTGHSTIFQLGGAYVHCFGNLGFELNELSVFAQYFNSHAPTLMFANNIEEFGGVYLSYSDVQRGKSPIEPRKIIIFISKMLSPFPKLHSFAFQSYKIFEKFRKFMRYYIQFLSFNFCKSNKIPDVELVISDVLGYNIIRYFHKYYAIHQSEGAFIWEKIKKKSYSSSFSSFSIDGLLRKICITNGKPKQLNMGNIGYPEPVLEMEGINGYNIIRVGKEFHAILQNEGTFKHSKLLSGEYTRHFAGQTLAEVEAFISTRVDSSSK